MTPQLDKLEKHLGYSFIDRQHLTVALTHSSYGQPNNERLEFLGDSILGWVIAQALFQQFPKAREGQLSRLRAGLVKRDTLAEIATELSLGDFIRLGSGELKSGGFRRQSILADAMEAVMGAIYQDAGIEACQQAILRWFHSRLAMQTLDTNLKDPKTRLQELLQARQADLPIYEVVKTHGKEHEQQFDVSCTVTLLTKPVLGRGSSRRRAEQSAAKKALKKLLSSQNE